MIRTRQVAKIRVAIFTAILVIVLMLMPNSASAQNGCAHAQAQIEFGQSYAHEVEARSRLITDPIINGYLDRIGQDLARNSDARFPFTVKVIDSDEVNAYSLPGGFIYLNSGLILAADNEEELAAVISHEIAHVTACHLAREMAREQSPNVASAPLVFKIASRLITRNTIYPKRDFESEADFLGVEYLYNAGYDPKSLPSFLKKINIIQKQGRGNRGETLESHRQVADRIRKTEQQIKTLLSPASGYRVETSEFRQITQRLSLLDSSRSAARSSDETALVGFPTTSVSKPTPPDHSFLRADNE